MFGGHHQWNQLLLCHKKQAGMHHHPNSEKYDYSTIWECISLLLTASDEPRKLKAVFHSQPWTVCPSLSHFSSQKKGFSSSLSSSFPTTNETLWNRSGRKWQRIKSSKTRQQRVSRVNIQMINWQADEICFMRSYKMTIVLSLFWSPRL